MLLRGPAGQAPSTIAGTGITDTTYEDTGLASGAAYSYAVQGYYQRQIGGFTVGDTGGVSGTAACTSAICFQRRIDAGGVDEARAVVAVGDGFVIAGKSSDDVLVMSIDARGTETWRTKLGSAGADAAHSIASLTGGDVVVAGEWADGAWLGRFRSTGDTVWTRRQMQSSYSGYNAAAVSSDGGVLLSGWATDYVSGTSDVLLARYSIDGVRTWLRVVGTPTTDEWAESMADGGPAGYVLGCVSDAAGGGAGDVWLVGCSAQGDTLWTSPFGGPVAERGTAVVTATGGGWVFAATTRSYGSGGWDIWLVSIGASREVRWTKTYGGTGADAVSSLACPASDGYAVLGSTESFGSDSTDFWLLRTTQGGDTLWSARYGGISADEGCDLVTAADGGYVLVGSTMSFDAADADIFVVKADCRGKTLPLQ